MSNHSTTNDEGSLEMKPLGDCSICGASREKQRGNQEGTVQKCSDCGSRWERSGGKLASQFELTDCPPEPNRLPEIKPKHKWKQMKADESELDREARNASGNFVVGLVLIGIGGLLSITVIGAIIGIPLMAVGFSAVGYGGAKGASVAMRQFISDMPEIAPGMDSDESLLSGQNALMLVFYYFTSVVSIPYLLYKWRGSSENVEEVNHA